MVVHKYYYLICWITIWSLVFVSQTRAAALNFEYEESTICIPNATFHIDCNRCKCSPSGMSMDCTDWTCATLQIHYDLLMNLTLACEPGEVFLYRDLKCLCTGSAGGGDGGGGGGGQALCSTARHELAHELRAASTNDDDEAQRRVISLGQQRASISRRRRSRAECPAGLVFKSQHGDTCICRHDNHHQRQRPAACLGVVARAAANSDARSPAAAANTSGDEKQKVCVPSTSFSLGCNQCVCGNDGFSFSCDSFPCLGVEMRDDQLLNLTLACTPSSVFLHDNQRHECLCSANGASAICSLMVGDVMPLGDVVVVTESRRSCTPGAVFKDACNVCICGDDRQAACTMMDCAYGWQTKRHGDDGRIVKKEDLWVQRARNKRFCRRNEGSLYCVYLRKY